MNASALHFLCDTASRFRLVDLGMMASKVIERIGEDKLCLLCNLTEEKVMQQAAQIPARPCCADGSPC